MAENTSFEEINDSFLSKITDDMYMELFPEETAAMLIDLMVAAIHWFEFPRVLLDYDLEEKKFVNKLTSEEVNIIATYMVVEWMSQQLASVENTRMKYSGSDFKFTSQANHMSKILATKDAYEKQGFHLQRLYKRRRVDSTGKVVSTLNEIMGV